MYNRHRVLDNTSTPSYNRIISSGPNCTVTSTSLIGGRIGIIQEMDDVVIPDFKRRSAQGEVFNNPMSSSKRSFSVGGSASQHTKTSFNCVTDSGGWNDLIPDLLAYKLGPLALNASFPYVLDSEPLVTAASVQARSNVKSPSVQGLAFVGEIQQTLSLLRNPISALTNLLKRTRKVSKSGIANAASSQTLAINFGVIPLMHDIEGLLEALVKSISERETARGMIGDHVLQNLNPVVFFNGSVLTSATMAEQHEETLIVRAGTMYAFSGRSLTDSLGVSLRDIPAAAWELLPWSFVVDWFSNVGNLIEALVASCTNEFLAEWVTIKRTHRYRRTIIGATTVSGWTVTQQGGKWHEVIIETFTRVPQNLTENLGFQFNFSLNRAPTLSALSLLMQQLTKGK